MGNLLFKTPLQTYNPSMKLQALACKIIVKSRHNLDEEKGGRRSSCLRSLEEWKKQEGTIDLYNKGRGRYTSQYPIGTSRIKTHSFQQI